MNEEKKYTQQEAVAASTEYFDGDNLAATVFVNKYALRDAEGNVYELTPDDMHRRLAREYARIEKKFPSGNALSEEQIYDYFHHFSKIVPAGSPMNGIGNPFQPCVSIANCFVVGCDSDSYNGIHYVDSCLTAIMKRRGGVGFCMDFLRPDGAKVDNAALTSTGAASFMERFSNTTKEVAMNGRRGALMLNLSTRHPDIGKFIDMKLEQGKVTGANISVKIDDEFMDCVKNDRPYTQQFPVNSENPSIRKDISAKDLFKKIVHNAWKSGEPGVLFWDTVLRESPADCYADDGLRTISTNPCSELTLSDKGACILSSVNLYSFVKNPFTSDACFDFNSFSDCVVDAQRLVDDLIELEMEKVTNIIVKIKNDDESLKLKQYEIDLWEGILDNYRRARRTGLGITAEGDMLAALGMKYGTPEASDFVERVHREFALAAYRSSVQLAKERGAFPLYDEDKEKDNPFLNRLKAADPVLAEEMHKYGRRNVGLLTIAPNGSVSIETQTTSGIEPVFMPVYKRRRKVNPNDKDVRVDFRDETTGECFEEYIVFHPKFKTWMQVNGIDTVRHYSQKEIDALVAQSPYAGATANEIDWKEKVRMQGRIQKWIDHSISVTINLPNSATEETVDELYRTAYEVGCKGLTVYRDGCRAGVLLSASDKKKDDKIDKVIEERPKTLDADVIRFKNNKENWIAFVGKLSDGSPYEIFTGLVDEEEGLFDLPKSVTSGRITKRILDDGSKSYDFEFSNKRGTKFIVEGLNGKFNPEFWNYSKLLSSVLRYKMPINYVLHLVDSLDIKEDGINSWKSGVKRALKKFINDGTAVVGGEKCPDCGSNLIYQDGCILCPNCGYSKCG